MISTKNNNQNVLSLNLWVLTFLLIGLIFFVPQLSAQQVTGNDSTTTKADTTLKYLNLWEYAFMMHEETSWLIKLYIPPNINNIDNIFFGIEKRIAPSFSINTDIGLSHSIVKLNDSIDPNNYLSFHASLETRWYYRMNKRVRKEKVSRNMSDNYFALGLDYTQPLNYNEPVPLNSMTLYAKWGFQRRFFDYGFVDFGVKAGAGLLLHRKGVAYYSIHNFVNVGLSFTKDKYKIDRDLLCPILRCYDADKFIIKSNISSLLDIFFTKYSWSFDIRPHLAIERKLGKSSFSINAEFQPTFSYSYYYENYSTIHNDEVLRNIWKFEGSVLAEGRWYYNLKHRIRTGKSGNGLSANYIAFGGSLKYTEGNYYDGDKWQKYIHLTTGWQRLFSKHLYFDVNIGFKYRLYSRYTSFQQHLLLMDKLAVGYRF